MSLKKRTDLVQQKSGRPLRHCFAGRFDSAAFCTFGGGGRQFGRTVAQNASAVGIATGGFARLR